MGLGRMWPLYTGYVRLKQALYLLRHWYWRRWSGKILSALYKPIGKLLWYWYVERPLKKDPPEKCFCEDEDLEECYCYNPKTGALVPWED